MKTLHKFKNIKEGFLYQKVNIDSFVQVGDCKLAITCCAFIGCCFFSRLVNVMLNEQIKCLTNSKERYDYFFKH